MSQLRPMWTRAQTAKPRPRAKRASPIPASHGSVWTLWPRNAPKRTRTSAMATITILIRSSRDHEKRPLFVERAARIQYTQNAAQPTAKTSSTVLTGTLSRSRDAGRASGRRHGDRHPDAHRRLSHERPVEASEEPRLVTRPYGTDTFAV